MSHLSLEERIRIKEGLDRKESFRSIARDLKRSPSTILWEIKTGDLLCQEQEANHYRCVSLEVNAKKCWYVAEATALLLALHVTFAWIIAKSMFLASVNA